MICMSLSMIRKPFFAIRPYLAAMSVLTRTAKAGIEVTAQINEVLTCSG